MLIPSRRAHLPHITCMSACFQYRDRDKLGQACRTNRNYLGRKFHTTRAEQLRATTARSAFESEPSMHGVQKRYATSHKARMSHQPFEVPEIIMSVRYMTLECDTATQRIKSNGKIGASFQAHCTMLLLLFPNRGSSQSNPHVNWFR